MARKESSDLFMETKKSLSVITKAIEIQQSNGKTAYDVVYSKIRKFGLSEEDIRKFFEFRINSKSVDPDTVVYEGDDVRVLPHFYGG